MALLMWPLLVFAYYKQKHALKDWLLFFAILGAIVSVLAAGEAVGLALVANIVGIPIVFLSARFVAWCIMRHVNRKKARFAQTQRDE